MARPVFCNRLEVGLINGVPAVEFGLLGTTPTRDEKTGRCSGSSRVSIANVSVSSSTSGGGLEGFWG